MTDNNPLIESALESDLEQAASLLRLQPQCVNSQDGDSGSTALQIASFGGDLPLVRLLLASGADPNILDNNHASALHMASKQGYADIAKLLIGSGAELEGRSSSGYTPLGLASSPDPDNRRVANILLQHGAVLDLTSAIWLGMFDYAKQMITDDPQVIARALFPQRLLSDCVVHFRTDLLSLLFQAMPSVPEIDIPRAKAEALLQACRDGAMPIAIIELLLQNGANPNLVRDSGGNTALTIARKTDHRDAISLLRNAGAIE